MYVSINSLCHSYLTLRPTAVCRLVFAGCITCLHFVDFQVVVCYVPYHVVTSYFEEGIHTFPK